MVVVVVVVVVVVLLLPAAVACCGQLALPAIFFLRHFLAHMSSRQYFAAKYLATCKLPWTTSSSLSEHGMLSNLWKWDYKIMVGWVFRLVVLLGFRFCS